MAEDTVVEGLEGVAIGTSRIGYVDGGNGELYYCGYSIDELVEHTSYEETMYLLLNNTLPNRQQLKTFEEHLAKQRMLPVDIENMIDWTAEAPPMDVLRTSVSMLAAYDEEPNNQSQVKDKLIKIAAKFPTIIAYTYRSRKDEDLVKPDEELGHAENFLYMLHGDEPDEEAAAAMDAALTLYAEHGMNASTFASVVTTSTLANPYSAVTSAVGALQGPLHGGATEAVVDMIEAVGAANQAEPFVQQKLDEEEKIPGFGHRVYETVDPRCKHFKAHAQTIGGDETRKRLDIVDALRTAVEEELGDKGIWPNADLYSGTLYNALGIPAAFYTTMFAMARVAGWSAHVLEQRSQNRIIRPRIKYTGDVGKAFIPVEDR